MSSSSRTAGRGAGGRGGRPRRRAAALPALILLLLAFGVLSVVVPWTVASAADDGWSWFRESDRRIRRIVPSPNFATDRTLFAGVAAGDEGGFGVLRSADSGLSWQPSNTGLDERMHALDLSPAPGPAPAGTLILTIIRRTYGKDEKAAGIFASTDGGATWTPRLANLDTWDVLSAAVSPNFANDGMLLLGVRAKGLFRSDDGGRTVKAANRGLSTLYPFGIAFTPTFAQDGTVFVATEGGGVFRSADGGRSWAEAKAGLDDLYVYSVAVSPGYARDKTVAAGGSQGSVFVSTDGGQSWTASDKGIKDPRLTTLSFSPDYPKNRTLYVGSESGGLFRSTDGGASWARIEAPFNAEIFSIVPLPGPEGETLIVSVSDGGIWIYARPPGGSTLAATATARAAAPTAAPRATATRVAASPDAGSTGGFQCLTYAIVAPMGLTATLMGGSTFLLRRRRRTLAPLGAGPAAGGSP